MEHGFWSAANGCIVGKRISEKEKRWFVPERAQALTYGKTSRTLKTRRADRLPLSGPPIACLCYPKSLRYADEMV